LRAFHIAALISLAAPAAAQQPASQWIQQQLDATREQIRQLEHSLTAKEQASPAAQPQPGDPFATKWPPDLHQSIGNVP
jgi:hypothetical protein